MAVTVLTKANFEELAQGGKTLLIDFWAPWCGPCKMLSPVVDEIAEEVDASVQVCKVNVDEEPELASQFGIMSIPTLIVWKDGRPVATSVGVKPKKSILDLLK